MKLFTIGHSIATLEQFVATPIAPPKASLPPSAPGMARE